MQDELTALEDNDTWELVNNTSNMNFIGTKWAFKIKYNADNTVERLKARLVAKGYNQRVVEPKHSPHLSNQLLSIWFCL